MFSKLLIKIFVKNPEDTSNKDVRNAYAYLGGGVGIVLNLLLFIVKLTIGLISNSIAIIADSINNLSDSASSVITILGFRLANKPADKEHPFGHGRIEYLAALIVSFIVLLVGFEFLTSSIDRILNPVDISLNTLGLVFMILTIALKVWSGFFNRYLGNKIDSTGLKAASVDAFSDVVSTSVVILSLLIFKFTGWQVDGIMGVIVSLLIMYSGFNLVKETISPLLGEPPSPELVKDISKSIMSYDYIVGFHDLIIHNYGPGRCMASIHAEVPENESIIKLHEVIDRAEREISEELNIHLVIHLDPVNVDDEEIQETKRQMLNILKNHNEVLSIHDFRVVGEGECKNIIFDAVLDHDSPLTKLEEAELTSKISEDVQKLYPCYNLIIIYDRAFVHH